MKKLKQHYQKLKSLEDVEKLVTKARVEDANTHRQIFASLQCKEMTKKLVNEIASKLCIPPY
jgi:large subunit ribosomal protein L17